MSDSRWTDVCIVCAGRIDQPSVEHIIPYAIGGSLETIRVCKPCNDRLGELVDAPFVTNGLMLGMRAFLRIATRSGELPSFPMRLDQNQSIRVDVTPAEYPAPPTIRPKKRVFDVPQLDGSVRRIISPGTRKRRRPFVAS